MDPQIEKLIQAAKSIKLSTQEQSAIKNRLQILIEKQSVRSETGLRHRLGKRSKIQIIFAQLQTMAIVLLIALFVGGGVSVAAQNALPGDALFPVKVVVNEGVRSFLTFSDEAKARLQAELAARRLDEAEKLAVEGRFDAEVREKIEANFSRHAERVRERIEEFKAREDFKAAAEVTANFETALKAHERILEKLGAEEAEIKIKTEVGELKTWVKAELATQTEKRREFETQVKGESDAATKTAAEGKLRAALNKIAEAEKFVARFETAFGAEAVTDSKADLKAANDKVAEGRLKFEAGAFGEAFLIFQEAHDLAQEAILLLEAKESFEIKVRTRIEGGEGENEERKSEIRIETKSETTGEDDVDREGSGETRSDLEIKLGF